MQFEVVSGPAKERDPIVQEFKKCAHPDSRNRPYSLGENVRCEGDINGCEVNLVHENSLSNA